MDAIQLALLRHGILGSLNDQYTYDLLAAKFDSVGITHLPLDIARMDYAFFDEFIELVDREQTEEQQNLEQNLEIEDLFKKLCRKHNIAIEGDYGRQVYDMYAPIYYK